MSDSVHGTVLLGKVIDGSLNPPIERGAVVFEGESIAWVGPEPALPERYAGPDYRRIAGAGRSIMPGLIDAHTHVAFGEARSEEELALYTPVEYRTLKAAWNAKKILQAGVTSAFDAATTYNIAQNLRDAIDAGLFPGPRFAVSGRQLTTHQGLEDSFPNEMAFPPGQAAVLIKSRDDFIEAIRYQVKDRVDAIKVSGSNDNLITPDSLDNSAISDEEYALIAAECHRLGRLCTVHARTRDSVLGAARAGFDVIFHASHIDEAGIEACLAGGAVITPTLTLLVNLIEAGEVMAGVSGIDAFKREVEAAVANLPKAFRAGVPFLCGSESGWSPVPYGEWHARELAIFVELLGFSPLEAIHCATLGATGVFRRFGEKIGKLEAGRHADILVLDGDPTADIRLLMDRNKILHVFKGGEDVDLTPPPPRKKEWYFERHKIFLNGRLHYDPATRGRFITP
ncbi:metal-dependent hydrolase family protein [Telmatospirillum siberiense]|uniref:Amidohydrolase family protein n=1 Tax=Telmatospirillum siberiense TaxID=382514 RepID=A0A2N3PSS2_9PROT|nr:amidohydrolase family protein [Telmatospirillum siberiense]PKU23449.1 amidohydrolase family protein [Telmatospirillum siberiense]